jgi:hypothetical protein
MGSSASRDAAEQQARAQLEAARLQAAAAERAIQFQQGASQAGLDLTQGQRRTSELGLAALMSGLGMGNYRAGPQSSGGGFTDRQGNPYTGPTFTDANGQPVDADGNQLRALPTYDFGGPSQEEVDAAASPYAGTFLERFNYSDLTADPSYQFRLDQGRRNLEASLAARGNRLGSGALVDITNYGQQAASQEYQSAFQRFEQQKQAEFNRLMGAINPAAAPSAAGQVVGSGNAMGNNVVGGGQAQGQGVANAGNAIAGGIVGSTNALVGGLSGFGNTMMANQQYNRQMDMFNQMYGNRGYGNLGSFTPTPAGNINIGLLGGGVPNLGYGGAGTGGFGP